MGENYLAHHGIKGQKWGVRRFQNPDGTLTAAGKGRREEQSEKRQIDKKSLAKKAAIGLGTAAAIGATAYLAKSPTGRAAVAGSLKRSGKNFVTGLERGTMKAGESMATAALVTTGAFAISKLAERYAVNDSMSDSEKFRNQLMFNTGKAGIESITNGRSASSNSSNNKSNTGEHHEAIKSFASKTQPSKKTVDKSSDAYKKLFTDSKGVTRDSSERAMIKTLINRGYDIDQVNAFINDPNSGLKHAFNGFDELYHFGIKGQKWGVRRFQNPDGSLTAAGKGRREYHSTSLASARARRQNDKVDEGFKKWKQGSQNRADAISLGKKANESRMNYERDRTNKDAKRQFKTDNKEYKKALKENTTYRKGQIRGEVGKDLSRKYLTEAKRVDKALNNDPTNKKLQKDYSRYMNQHDIVRAKARRAPEVGAARSARQAAMKRSLKASAKSVGTSAAIGLGVAGVNYILSSKNVTLNGQDFRVKSSSVKNAMFMGSVARGVARGAARYMY